MISLSQETEALARRLADAQRVSVDAAVRHALEAQAAAAGISLEPGRPRDRSPRAIAARRIRMETIAHEISAMPVLDQRTPQGIMDDLNAL